ncbi:pseudomurein-binding repeat protein [Methanobrevibacter cuticularis]|uniref:Pseudomurein-binding repeat protein n=1 Tax=Methanobrevibacter cuticularis TaxID=47311 RepID=A0A166CK08_9EURY|nr:transglutaminase domain-containing protein [Methanobrevibacter cuticularis]KZX14927.1 pseudomurein-binding repeat protein [Methanobrevibacter cuticularis]
MIDNTNDNSNYTSSLNEINEDIVEEIQISNDTVNNSAIDSVNSSITDLATDMVNNSAIDSVNSSITDSSKNESVDSNIETDQINENESTNSSVTDTKINENESTNSSVTDTKSNENESTNSSVTDTKSNENKSTNKSSTDLFAAGGSSSKFSKNDIVSAASELKKYVEKYGKLPDYLTISGEKISISDFLYLLSKVIVNLNSNNNSDISLKDFKDPASPSGTATNGNLYKANYLDLAKRIIAFMDANGQSPNYGSSSLGNIQFQTIVYGFAKIVDYFKVNKVLPNYVSFVKATSTNLNKVLPNYNGNNGLIVGENTSGNGNSGGSNSGNGTSGNGTSGGSNSGNGTSGSTNSSKFSKNDIVSAASELKKYVEKYGKLPDYLTISGKKVSISDFLYLLSKVIVNLNSNNNSDISLKGFKDPASPSGTATNGNLYKANYLDLAKRIVAFMDANGQSPNYGSSSLGNIQFQTIVYGFAKIVDYFKVNKVLPNYVSFVKATSSNLNKVLPNYNGNNGLIVGENTSGNGNSGNGTSGGSNSGNGTSEGSNSGNSTSGGISLADIKNAGSRIEAFVAQNGVLPNYVEIGGKQYSMSQFLYLASQAIVNINKGINSNIVAKDVKSPTSPTGQSISGNLYKSDFVALAQRVSDYITKNGQSPNYGSSTLGNIQFQSLILGFSKILEFVKTNNRLPDYLTLNIKATDTINGGNSNGGSSSGSIPNSPMNNKYDGSSLTNYLKASTNCQVNDATIQSLATSLTKNCKTELEKATAIYNYVRDKISYSFYYNTKYGAKSTLANKVGNCVDQTHLLISLMRASGIAARYVNGEATFSSGSRYGHVWAQVLIGDTWVVADTTSSKNSLGVIKNWNTNTASVYGKYSSISF